MKKLLDQRGNKPTAIILSALLTMPLFVGCGQPQASVPPPMDNTRTTATAPNATPAAPKKGLNKVQKGAIVLAGAAALYYLYNRQKNAKADAGANSKYYLSKNGRVYYRDANRQVHWVTPPPNGIQVPAEEAQQYRDYQGYNNRSTGRDLTSVPEAQSATY
ncbi:hypothetical protein H6F86_23875 [Phormidium sp. FACHB-592]|uniref:Uncharacterized protein n=1 Tax=Stenomitos frigidus AS-A4 TaxID=2933935 RepID=A0ABV0KSA9_9CYAN|nr:hypothetical protein [Phormidium sp. FACHB-592]MBD2076867.1 hypothetical protein [Phormidium sp. FACHB-592]